MFMLMFVSVCFSCQFVVRDGYNYAIHAVDPDTLVEWDHIEQVVSLSVTYYWPCPFPHSMQSRVYETVWCLSICSSMGPQARDTDQLLL